MTSIPIREYDRPISPSDPALPLPVRVVETDTDLYWEMAIELYRAVSLLNAASAEADGPAARACFICPVGPTFQYRRFVRLCDVMPVDLSPMHLFFMDEYLADDGTAISADSPLSFRGFIERELISPLEGRHGFRADQVHFPDPRNPAGYDAELAALGGAEICFAGVGINGHLAFNEPKPEMTDKRELAVTPSRLIELNPETVAINANTALGGAFELVPRRAVTVGMKSILASRRLRVYLNRPWQRAVARKILYGPVSAAFPASLVRRHPDAAITMTVDVAEPAGFGLR